MSQIVELTPGSRRARVMRPLIVLVGILATWLGTAAPTVALGLTSTGPPRSTTVTSLLRTFTTPDGGTPSPRRKIALSTSTPSPVGRTASQHAGTTPRPHGAITYDESAITSQVAAATGTAREQVFG